jgi:hypothetical protein
METYEESEMKKINNKTMTQQVKTNGNYSITENDNKNDKEPTKCMVYKIIEKIASYFP